MFKLYSTVSSIYYVSVFMYIICHASVFIYFRLALGNQRFPVRVQLLAMCSGELSAVIAWLISKCL